MNAGAFLHGEGAAPVVHAVLSPHRSLPPEGFAWFIGLTFALLLIPLVGLIGTAVVWGLMPFMFGALWLTWTLLRRNYRDGHVTEELSLWPDRIEIRHTGPDGAVREWAADPYWVKLTLHAKGGRVSDYLTLSGAGREVELGAFLSPDERRELFERSTRFWFGSAATPAESRAPRRGTFVIARQSPIWRASPFASTPIWSRLARQNHRSPP